MPAPGAGENSQPNLTVVPEPKRRRAPGELNMAQQRELVKAMQICTAALKPAYAAALAVRLITAALVNQLITDITAALNKSLTAAACTTGRKAATANKKALKKTLLASLRSLQAAAKQLHQDNPTQLELYYIGQKIDDSRAMLEAAGQGIINKSNEQRPPGVNTEVIVRVTGELQAFKTGSNEPATQQSNAKTERAKRDEMIESIKKRRMQIQFAADAEWGPRVPANVGVRGEFKIPADKAFNG
jgi:hypothetical protein